MERAFAGVDDALRRGERAVGVTAVADGSGDGAVCVVDATG